MHAISCAAIGRMFGMLLRRAAPCLLGLAAAAHAYTITISPVPTGGTVTGSGLNCGTGGSTCSAGGIPAGFSGVTLIATPDPGYSFVQWDVYFFSTHVVDTTNPKTFTMPPGDLTGTATFQATTMGLAPLSPATKTLVIGDSFAMTASGSPAVVGDTVLTLDAQPAGIVSVPPTATIPAGQTSVDFLVTALSAGEATVTATAGAQATSAIVTVVSAPTVPGAPQFVAAFAGVAGDASVSFAAPISDGASPITSYTVTSDPGGITASGPASPIHITGLTNSTPYTFTVTATNAIGTGPASVPSSSVIPGGVPASEPQNCNAAVSGSLTILVSCQPPASDGGSTISSYTATSSPGGLAGSSADPGSIPVSGLTRGVSYTFTVTATNVAGIGAASLPTNPEVAVATPGAPTSVTATGGVGTIGLTWSPPADDGGGAIFQYNVYQAGIQVAMTSTTSSTVSAAPGVPSSFTVSAMNVAGEGPQSVASNTATATAGPPGAPTQVHAMGGEGRATVSFLAPASNGGAAITSYVVTSSPGGFTGTGARSPIDVNGLANGTAYTFTVAAVNVAGTGTSSVASNLVTPHLLGPRVSAYAYVTNAADNLVAVIDTATNEVVTTVRVGNGPVGVASNAAGTRVYVANNGDGAVSVIDTSTHTVIATIPLNGGGSGLGSYGLAVNAAGTRVYVTNTVANSVSVVDATNNTWLADVAAAAPVGVAVHPSGSPFYVASSNSSQLLRFDGTSNAALAPAPTGGSTAPWGVALAPDGSAVYVTSGANPGSVSQVVGTALAGTVPLASGAFGVAVSPTTGRRYVALPTANQVVVLDGAGVVTTIPVSTTPAGIAVTPSGTRVLVANSGDGTVSVIDPTNNTAIASIPVGNQPIAFGTFIGPVPASVPDAPPTVVATAGDAQASVAFAPPANNGGAPITSYTVTSSPDGLTASGAASPIIVPGLTNGTTYTFTVRATNAAGTGPASAPSNAVTPGTLPGAPTNVSALAGDGQATLSFSAPATNGGFAITLYRVTCAPGPVIATGSASPIVVNGLVNSTAYSCTVSATNSAGTGPQSGSVGVTPLATSTTALSVSVASPVENTSVTFTATVTGAAGTATGSVTFRDGTVDLATVPLNGSGQALLATSTLALGAHSITAHYQGSAAYFGSSSAAHVVTVVSSNPPRLGNISTRMQVLTGGDVMIGGFIIGGSTSKTVVVRARGPSLVPYGITNALMNPMLTLVRSADQAVLATNDDWGSAANAADIAASGFAPADSRESAILVNLPPGAYTAIVQGVGGTTGVGIVEVFEVDNPTVPLANISTRGEVLTGGDVMIGGFIVNGTGPQTVVVRARGPSLVPYGITNALMDPTLTLVRSADQSIVATNDNWGDATNAAQVTASGFAPSDAHESAILVTLDPGAYTAIVSGVGGTTGVGIVEVFTMP